MGQVANLVGRRTCSDIMGGSTGMNYFRPKGARYEAKDIRVEGCVFVGSDAPVAFTGVDGATFRYNTIYRPTRWILRILQETTAPGFAACRNGRFEHNLIVFRRSEFSTFVNIGPHTQPETFTFADNWWFCRTNTLVYVECFNPMIQQERQCSAADSAHPL
jgi:hypothetical protein